MNGTVGIYVKNDKSFKRDINGIAGFYVGKEEFFEKIWNTEFVGDVTLNVHIRHLREKIEEDASNPKYIKTVWGSGFILEDKP